MTSLATKMIAVIEENGGSVLSSLVKQAMNCADEDYAAARNELKEAGRISITRGRNSTITLLNSGGLPAAPIADFGSRCTHSPEFQQMAAEISGNDENGRLIVRLNDQWAITADRLQYMITRVSPGGSLAPCKFFTHAPSMVRCIDRLGIVPTDEAKEKLAALPEYIALYRAHFGNPRATGPKGERVVTEAVEIEVTEDHTKAMVDYLMQNGRSPSNAIMEALSWDRDTFLAVRNRLLSDDVIEVRAGKGGGITIK